MEVRTVGSRGVVDDGDDDGGDDDDEADDGDSAYEEEDDDDEPEDEEGENTEDDAGRAGVGRVICRLCDDDDDVKYAFVGAYDELETEEEPCTCLGDEGFDGCSVNDPSAMVGGIGGCCKGEVRNEGDAADEDDEE
jgi:hypothetical protein